MGLSRDFLDYVLEQLAPLGGVTQRRMFGGAGLYRDGLFFAVLAEDVLYFKTDEASRGRYEAAGCEPFNPMPDREGPTLSYWSVPADVLEQPDELAAWARAALAAAARKPSAKPRRRARS